MPTACRLPTMIPGTKVVHPTYGVGTIDKVVTFERADLTGKWFHVRFNTVSATVQAQRLTNFDPQAHANLVKTPVVNWRKQAAAKAWMTRKANSSAG